MRLVEVLRIIWFSRKNDVSMIQGQRYATCISSMLHRNETRAQNAEQTTRSRPTEIRIVRWMETFARIMLMNYVEK